LFARRRAANIVPVMNDRATPPALPGQNLAWLLLVAALLAWHGWMTLALFDAQRPWERLRDGDPVVSGRHALHLYHGRLGAAALLERGSLSCYDPAFHAGYPKTPVFDGGSRPAELAPALAGAKCSPAAYKFGLAVILLSAPLFVFTAARGMGLSRGVAALAMATALLSWWGRAGREAVEAGDVDMLLAALAALAQLGLLLRYHERPGVLSLAGVVGCGLVAWFAQPLFMVLLAPVFLIYYLGVAHRHSLWWHLPLVAGLTVAVALNAFWLQDWLTYWYVRIPICAEEQATLPGIAGAWASPVWGEGIDRTLVAVTAALGVAGTVVLYATGSRPAARVLCLATVGLFALVGAGLRSHFLGRLGTGQLLPAALLFASLPAAFAVAWAMSRFRSWWRVVPCAALAAVPLLVWQAAPQRSQRWAEGMSRPEPLLIGLGEERSALVAQVKGSTNGDARILWEERKGGRLAPRWSALLPVLTDRAFVGGLDDGAGIEHATCGLTDGALAGRPLNEWTDGELADYCRRYNVSWVVCGDAAKERFARWPSAGTPQSLPGGRWLVAIDRKASFALAGRAEWRSADARGILLADLVPEKVPGEEEGQVLLSLHYQAGMRVSPARVRLEKAVDSHDNVPFVRLRMKDPVGRVLITWESR
jgi:hypothetical protein